MRLTLAAVLLAAALGATACASPNEPTAAPSQAPTNQPHTVMPTGQSPTNQPPTAAPTDEPATPAPTISPSAQQTQPAAGEIQLEPFAEGLGSLTFATHAGDGLGLLYVVEQRGVIRIVDSDGSVRDEPFLDISDRVSSDGEHGLLGLAFHPDYSANGRLFVDYTDTEGAGNTHVAEFARSGEAAADPASERDLLTIEQPFANHNGGMLAFGPDGYLYVSTGDGGSAGDPRGNGQNRSTLLGAILRIDVDAEGDAPYGVPPDNPFVDQADAAPEIWHYGLRNPWRFSFDRQTDALFIGDVGQGTWEEIDVAAAGEGGINFGWNLMEGPVCFSARCDETGLTVPVASYRHDNGCTVVGGYVYRGASFPELAGRYLLVDYCSGNLWTLDSQLALETGQAPITQVAHADTNPTAFAEDEAGELYLIGQNGIIERITAP
jgi:glucose/arabinose dehydrogenase